MKYSVTFKAHYNSNGETDDYPGDFLYVNCDADADDPTYEELPENPGREGYCKMIVEYEIDSDDQNIFERCLDDCPTVTTYEVIG